ncbi:hypothetical protein Sdagh_51410 [Streptomyces daghestanicus]|uniref:DAGKc domain-containing protein n=1 Tax=Streptomyces daghestanicus TaxID=66885 RepID=A0ABQ3Q814_9ACTN|nr:hypothetical protein [Streptomyces daghestanicus]GHI33411.1 hypothetical protein Sdagh_51410 [Streptomyces daghestanicus]
MVLLRPDAARSADLSATVDALRHEDRDHATVVVEPGDDATRGAWRHLGSVLDKFVKSGVTTVRLVWAGAAAERPGRTAPARRISDDWGLAVVAPAGPVVVVPGGSLFAPTGPGGLGGWWRLEPGSDPRPLGLRHPLPVWEDAAALLASDAVERHVVVSVPAGVQIRRAEPLPGGAADIGAFIPVDRDRLTVVVGAPGHVRVTARGAGRTADPAAAPRPVRRAARPR